MATGSVGQRRCLPESNIVVAAAAFWVNFCILGIIRSNAVLYKALLEDFGVNREEAAWPSGIFGFFMCVTGALSGFLSHHIRIRYLAMFGAVLASLSVSLCSLASHMHQIAILYGAFQGIGVGLIVPLTHVVLNQNFSQYKAMALGIAYSGSSAGSFVFPLLSNVLLKAYGLDGTFLLLGSIMLNSVLGAILYRTPGRHTLPTEEEDGELESFTEPTLEQQATKHTDMGMLRYRLHVEGRPYVICPSKSEFSLPEVKKGRFSSCCSRPEPSLKIAFEVLSSPHFLIVSLTYAIYFSISAIFLMVALDFAQDRGVPGTEGVFLVSAFSAGDLGGRLSFAWIADTSCMSRTTLVRLYLLSMGMLCCLLTICPAHGLPWLAALLGLLNGGVIPNHSVLLSEYLGLHRLPLAMGFSTCFVGLTGFFRPMLIGFFRDLNQSYDFLFVSIGLSQIAVTVLWFVGEHVCRRLTLKEPLQ